jgi:hypothetical protein
VELCQANRTDLALRDDVRVVRVRACACVCVRVKERSEIGWGGIWRQRTDLALRDDARVV